MFDVDSFLDRAKVAAGVTSDYALAVKVLGYPRQSVITNWRTARTMPDERAILKLCELTGDDPEHVAACIQSMRAANDDAADLWRRIAERLKGAAAVVMAPAAVALLFIAATPGTAEAHALPSFSDAAALCVMSNLLRRFAMRLYSLCRRKRGGAETFAPA